MSIRASCSCNKQQQAMATLPTMMDTFKAITDCNGCNQCHHREVQKCSWEEPLKSNKEGRGNQPWSLKVALPTNAIRASWGRCEYHGDTHPTTRIIAARASIAAMRAQWMQAAMFCQPVQEPRFVRLTQQGQLPSPSAWPTQAAQDPWRWLLWQQKVWQQEESLLAWGQGF